MARFAVDLRRFCALFTASRSQFAVVQRKARNVARDAGVLFNSSIMRLIAIILGNGGEALRMDGSEWVRANLAPDFCDCLNPRHRQGIFVRNGVFLHQVHP
jgi:hypothetical protein